MLHVSAPLLLPLPNAPVQLSACVVVCHYLCCCCLRHHCLCCRCVLALQARALTIALVFHQGLEGLSLGSVIARAEFNLAKSVVMVLLYRWGMCVMLFCLVFCV